MARRQNDASRFAFSGDSFILPKISASNLHDILTVEGYDSELYMPEHQWFRWYDVEGVTSAFSMPVDLDFVLHLRYAEEAADLFHDNPDSYALVLSDSTDLPECLEPYRGRIIVLGPSSKGNPLAMVQEIFLRMLRWENQLNLLVSSDGALEALLNVGASMFEGFTFVAGVDNNVIGYSTEFAFPNDEYERQMREGWLSSTKPFVDALFPDGVSSPFGDVVEVIDAYGNVNVVAPIRYEGSLFGFVVLVVGNRLTMTTGLKDQFAHFAQYVVMKCRTKLKTGVERDIPHFYFLTALLRGEVFTRAAIEQNLGTLGIPLDAFYKVVVVNPRETRLRVDILMDALRCLNSRKSLVVLFQDYLVAILYEQRSDAAISHRATLEDLNRFIYKPYGIVSGVSQVFNHISDVRLGFRQAVYALATRDAIEVERSLMKEEGEFSGISFEMALPYFLIKENEVDREFHEFCLSHSPLESLLESDLDNGTNNFLLLWLFLLYERNASLVGRRLYMHRNSVLYHIRQIEKRYDFQLDSWYAREKLLMDYRFLFLRLPDDVLERLFQNG